jgi:hypothetical protein
MAFTNDEIDSLIEEETKLPPTHRQGYDNQSDDVALDADGRPILVPTPETPNDRFN